MIDHRLRIGNNRREPDLGDEAASGTRDDLQRGTVRRGDRTHDREPETDAVSVRAAIAIQPLERHQESLDVFRGNRRPGVGDPDRRALDAGAGVDAGLDVHVALWDVVPHGVVEEVRDQTLEQSPVTLNRGARQRGVEPRARLGARISGEHLVRNRRQVDRFAAIETLLAAGEREQRLNQSLLLLAGH